MDLAAWAKPASPWEKNCRMNWCVSPAGTCPLPGPSQFFLPCLWGMGSGSSSSHIHPCPEVSPFPSPPYRRQRKGKGLGGAGLPLGTAVAQSISPKPRKFLLPKRKKEKKRKKIPAATFPPCPIGTVKTGSVGLLGGWLRAGTLSGKSGGVPCRPSARPTLGFPSPHCFPLQATHQRWPSPAPRPLGYGPYTGAQWGYCTALERVSGGTLAPSIPCPLPAFPRAGHFLP